MTAATGVAQPVLGVLDPVDLSDVTDGIDNIKDSIVAASPKPIIAGLALTGITIGVVWLIATFRRAKK